MASLVSDARKAPAYLRHILALSLRCMHGALQVLAMHIRCKLADM